MTSGNQTCVSGLTGVVCYGVFFNYRDVDGNDYVPGVDCSSTANFYPDISGIGVVISFGASAVLTTSASIVASILDNIAARRNSILPARWQPKDISSTLRARCTFMRRILERLILNLADQQLVTGFALLIGAWVKLHSNPVLKGFWKDAEELHFPNLWLTNAQFNLVVFLCMASSSSHLACVLVLREYLEDHVAQARLRLLLIILFGMFLAVTIALASGFTVYFYQLIFKLFNEVLTVKQAYKRSTIIAVLSISMAVPVIIILGVCWLCTLQLMPHFKDTAKQKIRSIVLKRLRRRLKLSKIWHSGLMRLLPESWRDPLTRFIKRCFWFALVGNEFMVFILQVILAMLSLVWMSLQRLASPPNYSSELELENDPNPPEYTALCSLHHVAGKNQWASFGQLLPIILLLLPVLSAYGTYIDILAKERDKNRVSGYASIPGWDMSPSMPKRKQSSRRTGYRDESELSLLNSQARGHESSISLGSTFSRAHYARHESSGSLTSPGFGPHSYSDRPSPVPLYPAFSPEIQRPRDNGGYFGWPSGASTAVDEQQYTTHSSSRWG